MSSSFDGRGSSWTNDDWKRWISEMPQVSLRDKLTGIWPNAETNRLGDARGARPSDQQQRGEPGAPECEQQARPAASESGDGYIAGCPSGTEGFYERVFSGEQSPWSTFELIGPDGAGKYRRIEPELAPVAPRVPETMAQLRAFGNGICPQLAAEFIAAFNEVISIL